MGESPAAPEVMEGLSRYDRHRLQAGLRRLAETGASTLEVARVALWLYGDAGDRLHRIHLYHRSSGEHVAGGELRRNHFPAYFQALDEGGLVAAADVHRDPRTRELSEPYAAPLGINSWIDAPVDGDLPTGILRFEHLGPAREWSSEERSVARALATSVGALVGYFDARRRPVAGERPEGAAPEPAEADGRAPEAQGDGQGRPPAAGAAGSLVSGEDVKRAGAGADGAGPPTPGEAAVGETTPGEEAARAGPADELVAEAASSGGDRLALRWQPIERAADESRVGVEALLRLRRPGGEGLAAAAEFVPRTERSGEIVSLDRWVLERATARADAWGPGDPDWIALNVSPISLIDDGYRSALLDRAEDGSLDPARILVQVALDLNLHPTVDVGRALFTLWEQGFGVCLDLNGTTDELLEIALTALPADVLEVTPGTVERWDRRGPPEVVQQARQGRGLRLLAKKLEEPAQLRRARALECEFLAGRLLAPPAAADQLSGLTAGARTTSAGRPDRDGS